MEAAGEAAAAAIDLEEVLAPPPAAPVIAGDVVPGIVDRPTHILGSKLQCKFTFDTLGFSVLCNNPLHRPGCERFRSAHIDVDIFGHRSPELYLAAWLSKSHTPREIHRKYRPTRAQVQEYVDSLGA
eukprot:5185231-Pyramimonas_sp.AAC.1